jgi:hypothetical protein
MSRPRGGLASWAIPVVLLIALAFGCIRWQALIAAQSEADKLNQDSASQRRALIAGCRRTTDRNAYLRVRFRPDALTADRFTPLLDCPETVDAGGREVPLSRIKAARLVHRTALEVRRNESLVSP